MWRRKIFCLYIKTTEQDLYDIWHDWTDEKQIFLPSFLFVVNRAISQSPLQDNFFAEGGEI